VSTPCGRCSTAPGRPIRAALADDLLIVLLAPPPGDAHAEAARAGLENMARTPGLTYAGAGSATNASRLGRAGTNRAAIAPTASTAAPTQTALVMPSV